MRIGFISDTHGGFRDTVKALEFLGTCDRIFHLGDVLYHGPRNALPGTYDPARLAEYLKDRHDITYIHGNCDADVDELVIEHDLSNRQLIEEVGDQRLLLDHGYRFSKSELLRQAKAAHATMVITGHTHLKQDEWIDGIRFLNPGSTTLPRDGSRSCYLWEDGAITIFTWAAP